MAVSFQHAPSPHIQTRRKVGPPTVADMVSGINGRIALTLTRVVGTMWCAYAFAGLALVALPAALSSGSVLDIVQWISQTFIQLVMLSVIMVGQNIIGQAADRRSEMTYKDADATFHEAEQIQQVSRDTLPLLEEIRDHVADQARVNRAIARIDALRARMNELGATYDLVTQLTQSTELKRFQADRKLSGTKQMDANDRQRQQVARDIDNVRGVMDAAADFRRLMDDVIAELSARASATAQTSLARREAA